MALNDDPQRTLGSVTFTFKDTNKTVTMNRHDLKISNWFQLADQPHKMHQVFDFSEHKFATPETFKEIKTWVQQKNGTDSEIMTPPLIGKFSDNVTCAWDEKFIHTVSTNNRDLSSLFNLMTAASFLGIQGLLYLCGAFAASIIKTAPQQ